MASSEVGKVSTATTTGEVGTRFAPSPTGFLHVGGVRTALFSWLLARHSGGKFVLRIEDTDRERLVPEAVRGIIEDLQWLGIELDEGPSVADLQASGNYWDGAPGIGGPFEPYVQSLRLHRYKEAAEQLIASGWAYRCDCSPERLKDERDLQMARKEPPGYAGYCRNRNVPSDRPHVVRLKIPEGRTVHYVDGIKGAISWQSLSLRDPVMLKSDGYPTYHLAVVVDDHDMQITHVIRSDEWVPSTPIHLLAYEALGWKTPLICHPPVVLGQDGKKLSKRHGATFVRAFREEGYLPEALFNFMALIGWAPGDGDEQEIFTKEELIQKFTLEHVNNAAGVFSYEKLNWMNGQYIRKLSHAELAERIRPFLLEAGLKIDEERFTKIIPHIQERMTLLKECVGLIEFLFVDTVTPELPSMQQKGIDFTAAQRVLELARERFSQLSTFDIASLKESLKAIADELGLPSGGVFVVVRIAVTGKKATPPLFESIEVLGREKTLERLENGARLLESLAGSSPS